MIDDTKYIKVGKVMERQLRLIVKEDSQSRTYAIACVKLSGWGNNDDYATCGSILTDMNGK